MAERLQRLHKSLHVRLSNTLPHKRLESVQPLTLRAGQGVRVCKLHFAACLCVSLQCRMRRVRPQRGAREIWMSCWEAMGRLPHGLSLQQPPDQAGISKSDLQHTAHTCLSKHVKQCILHICSGSYSLSVFQGSGRPPNTLPSLDRQGWLSKILQGMRSLQT